MQRMTNDMNYQRIALLLMMVMTIGTANIGLADEKPPKVFIETNKCPGEYCRFGLNFVALKDVDTFDKPNGIKIGSIIKGAKVKSITGDVYSIPLLVERVPRRGTIMKDGKIFPAPEPDYYANENLDIAYGEKFFVMRYIAEGWWVAWHKGAIISVPEIWDIDKLGNPQNTWWVQLKTDNGMNVWVKAEPDYHEFYKSFECVGSDCNVW